MRISDWSSDVCSSDLWHLSACWSVLYSVQERCTMSQRNQAGGASGYCGRPSFSESQACLLDVQMCSVGSNKSGSSRLPIVRPIVFAFCRSEKSVVPHWVQKPRRTPEDRKSTRLNSSQ